MKRNTLPKILHSLETMQYEFTVDPAISQRARAAGRQNARVFQNASRRLDHRVSMRNLSDGCRRRRCGHRRLNGRAEACADAGHRVVQAALGQWCGDRLGARRDRSGDGQPTIHRRLHAIDTQRAGAGISDAHIVKFSRDAPARIEELLELGATFDRDASGELALGREAAHQRRRIVKAGGDATGHEILNTLIAAVPANRRRLTSSKT